MPSHSAYCSSLQSEITQNEQKLKGLKNANNPKNPSKKQLESTISTLKSNKEDCVKSHYMDEQSRESLAAEIQNAEEVISKLKKFATELGNNSGNNIFTHLCSGLETFLGFNSASKGYTGEGIVYSDLDRLCDGVMGFLSGVLGAVKDDEALKTYDKNVTPNINTVISKLQSSIGSGREGLVESVAEVKAWLEEYNDNVKNYTNHVVNSLTSLNKNLDNDLNIIDENNVLTDQHKAWQKSVGIYEQHVKNAKGALKDVDSELQNKLQVPIGKIDSAVEVLKNSAENAELGKQVTRVDKELVKQEKERERKERFSSINEALNISQKFLVEDFDREYKNVLRVFDDIKLQITDLDPKNTVVGGDGKNSKLYQQVDGAKASLENILLRLEGHVGEIEHWMYKTRNDIELVEKDVNKILYQANGGEGSKKGAITFLSKDIKNKVVGPLNTFMVYIDAEVTRLVDEAKTKIGPLEDVYKHKLLEIRKAVDEIQPAIEKVGQQFTGLNEGQRSKFEEILKNIKADVVEIKGTANSLGKSGTGLADIRNKLKIYAHEFTTNEFGNTVKVWVQDILARGIAVNHRLSKYVQLNRIKSLLMNIANESDVKLRDPIKEQIKLKLEREIYTADRVNLLNKVTGNVADDASKVQQACNQLANELEKRINIESVSVSSNKFIKEIADDIGRVLGVEISTPDYYDEFLILAINDILHQIVKKARTAATELEWLIGEKSKAKNNSSIAKEIDAAYHVANSLDGKLVGATVTTKNLAANVDAQLRSVQQRVEDIKQHNGNVIKDIPERQKQYNALDGALENVKQSAKGLNVKATEHVLDTFYSDITHNLTEVMDEISTLATQGVRMSLDLLKSQNISETLTEIKNKIGNLIKDKLHNVIRGAIDTSINIIKHLEFVPDHVEKRKGEVKKMLDDSKIQLEEKLHAIRLAVRMADDLLESAIQSLQDAYEKAYNSSQTAVSKSFQSLTSAVRSLFAEQKKADLQALKGVVEEQKKVIESVIDKDKRTGIKGLLKAVNGITVNVETPDPPTFEGTDTLLDAIKSLTFNIPPNARDFKKLTGKYKAYYNNLDTYIKHQVTDQTKTATSSPPTDPAEQLAKIKKDFDKLLEHLQNDSKKYNYDNKFVDLLSTLSSSLSALQPSHFSNPRHPELLDAVRQGLQGFVKEMGRVYVNGYDDGKPINWDTNKLVENKPDSGNSDQKEKLTSYGEKLSKICLTILDVVSRDIDVLREKCPASGNREGHKIISSNSIGKWFQGLGYKVSDSDTKQHGELVNKIKDGGIKSLCETPINGLNKDVLEVLRRQGLGNKSGTTLYQLLNHLYDRLDKYRKVCHLRNISGAKPPTTVNQMLYWFAGMPWHPMFNPMKTRLDKLLEDEIKEYKINTADIPVTVPYRSSKSMIYTANLKDFKQVFENVMTRSPKILVTILGHGDADGRYGCDFFTNPDDLLYPASPDQCLDMLVDIALRLNHQIRFLYKMCHNGKQSSGWQDCWYGKHVAGSAWNCNRYPCDEQDCDQKHNLIADQTANQNIKCGVKSPLQSFLEDGLPGFLPHQFTSPGCKLTCTVANHRGIPCKTPMGFSDLATMASRSQTGEELKKALEEFSAEIHDPLTIFCTFLTCVLRRPPQTLGDMFAFFYGYLDHWGGEHKKTAFEDAVNDAIFGQEYNDLDPSKMFGTSRHSDGKAHSKGDLFTIVKCYAGDESICGFYLQSLSFNIYNIFSKFHKNHYLSWIVYLTETFYNHLCKLRDECCNNCNKPGTRCYGNICSKNCEVRSCYQNNKPVWSASISHDKKCKSIAQCPLTLPTLNKYGFAFWSAHKLSGNAQHVGHMRTCEDFCKALNNVLSDKESKSAPLAELVFRTIPQFLWNIRSKFFWTTVALWSASFLYLIIVMVGRLDLLHIKSHLRIPSSHKITAQSLLAAAQVGRLAKISYLQP